MAVRVPGHTFKLVCLVFPSHITLVAGLFIEIPQDPLVDAVLSFPDLMLRHSYENFSSITIQNDHFLIMN